MRDGSWRSSRKDERLHVIRKIVDEEHFPLVWYDQGKVLYSLENLTVKFKKEYQCQLKHKKTEQVNRFRFLIVNLVRTYSMKTIFEYVRQETPIRPVDSVRVVETLLKQKQQSEMVQVRNQFYPKNQRLEDLGKLVIFGIDNQSTFVSLSLSLPTKSRRRPSSGVGILSVDRSRTIWTDAEHKQYVHLFLSKLEPCRISVGLFGSRHPTKRFDYRQNDDDRQTDWCSFG